jgi:hypothetical protein
MPASFIALLAVAALVASVVGPLRTRLAVLVGVTLLVPDSLVFPFGISPDLRIQRIVLVAFVAGLVLDRRRHGPDEPTYRLTPVHVALTVLLAAGFATGVLLARDDLPPATTVNGWLAIVDQAVFFTAVLVALRRIGDVAWAARLIVGVAAFVALMAVLDHVLGFSLSARIFFSRLPEQATLAGARPIEIRGGDVRVRGSASFALAYAWITAGLVPLAVAVAATARRRWWMAVPPLLLLTTLWTYSRSALGGLALGVVVLVAVARDRRITAWVATAGAIAVLAALSLGVVDRAFTAEAAAGSDAVRVERLPVVLGAAAERPFIGTGFGGVTTLGFAGTDATYVSTYVELGAIGVAALVLALGCAVVSVAPIVRAPAGARRIVGGAALAGVVVGVAGAAFFDLFPPAQGSRPFWLLAALGIHTVERAAPVRAIRQMSFLRLAYPIVGLAAGVAVLALAPRSEVETFEFQTISIAVDAKATQPIGYIGRTRVRTACAAFDDLAEGRDLRVDCLPLRTTTDSGSVRIAGHRVGASAATLVDDVAAHVKGFSSSRVATTRAARPAWASTAPLWLTLAGALVAAAAPRRRRRSG